MSCSPLRIAARHTYFSTGQPGVQSNGAMGAESGVTASLVSASGMSEFKLNLNVDTHMRATRSKLGWYFA